MTGAAAAPPALSIVVASRNDTHGVSILERTRLFLNALFVHTRRRRFPVEIIFVEWNPPADRPPLSEVLPAPSRDDVATVRYVRVPATVHQTFRRAREVPLFQMIAKNVGIRRARTGFILCTNVDLVFSHALMDALAGTALRTDTYYRANRCDVPDQIDPAWDLDRQLDWCQSHVIRRLGRDMRYRHINLEHAGIQHKGAVKKWLFDKMAIAMNGFWSPEKRRLYQIDSFACGDFTLMAKEAWLAIQGYLELDLYSLHVDTLALVAATALGYKQHVFPGQACSYHIDHPSGWEALSPLERVRFLEQRPALDYSLVHDLGLHALARREPFGLNGADWGYADMIFDEQTIGPGDAAAPAVAHRGIA